MVAMLADIYPSVFKTSKKGRPILVAAISVTCFLIGIPMLTQVRKILFFDFIFGTFIKIFQGGIYVFQLFDKYGASGLAVLWFSYFSSTAIAWFHGMDNFYAKLDKMYKKVNNALHFYAIFVVGNKCLCVSMDDFWFYSQKFNSGRLLASLLWQTFRHGQDDI